MAKLEIEIDEVLLRRLVKTYLEELLGNVIIDEKEIFIEVMTKNNYRVKEWEQGAFRARIGKSL